METLPRFYMNMSSDSDNDFVPLRYETPSPYKKRKPLGLSSKRKLSKSSKKLDSKLDEIMKIEDKYNRRILESINKRLTEKDNIYDDQQRLVDGFISNSFCGDNRKTPSAVVKDVLSAPLNSSQTFSNYFSPNQYFNKFNQDSLKPNHFFSDFSIFGKLTNAEIVELIKTDSLDIVDDMSEMNELVKFLLYLGSVTENILITGRLTQLLSENFMPYLDFMTIVENWGKVDQTIAKSSHDRPQVHNFVFILDKITFSLHQYTLVEIKEVFKFLINVSVDSLLINQGHNLLQPLFVCIQDLLEKGIQKEQIVDLIDYEKWNIYCAKHVVLLLLNCRAPKEIGILLGFKALSKILIQHSDQTSTIDMDTLFELLLNGEEQLIALDLQSFQQSCVLFELMSYKIAGREKFDIWRIIRFVEKIRRRFSMEIKSVYLSEIVNRMRIMWKE